MRFSLLSVVFIMFSLGQSASAEISGFTYGRMSIYTSELLTDLEQTLPGGVYDCLDSPKKLFVGYEKREVSQVIRYQIYESGAEAFECEESAGDAQGVRCGPGQKLVGGWSWFPVLLHGKEIVHQSTIRRNYRDNGFTVSWERNMPSFEFASMSLKPGKVNSERTVVKIRFKNKSGLSAGVSETCEIAKFD